MRVTAAAHAPFLELTQGSLMTDCGAVKPGTTVGLRYFTTLQGPQQQHLQLFHIENAVRRLFLGWYTLNCFAMQNFLNSHLFIPKY